MDSAANNLNNHQFLDDFSIADKLLGKGGSGNVVKGVHLASNKPVAIKVIDPLQRPNAERAQKLFKREVKLHSLVSHLQGVVRLLGASPPSSEVRCYLATELATMGDLFRQLKKRRVLPEHQVRDVVLQLIAAVAGLHRNNICHRDIKPENILLERSQLNLRGVVLMVADFGHAGLLPTAGKTLLYTRDCGTPGYKAPELSDDCKHGHGLAADLWSVGAVMNDCFSFKARQPSTTDPAFWTRDIWESVSTNARHLLSRLLEADPSKRITADEALRHPWLAGGNSETVYRGISASGCAKSARGKSTTLGFPHERSSVNNATSYIIDNIKKGVPDIESNLQKIESAGRFKIMKTEKDGGLKQPHSYGTNTNDTDNARSHNDGSGKTAKGEVTRRNAEEGGSVFTRVSFRTLHLPSSEKKNPATLVPISGNVLTEVGSHASPSTGASPTSPKRSTSSGSTSAGIDGVGVGKYTALSRRIGFVPAPM